MTAGALLLAACGLVEFGEEETRGTIGYVEGFIGGVAADEPRAALVGRDILSAGGNAADAAVAMYFTLAVTMPSAASLGGGGVCLVHDAETEETLMLDFVARAPQDIPPSASRPSAVPGNPRGFFALYARYGLLRWESLIAPASNLARFGTPVSRALAQDIYAASSALADDPAIMAVFMDSGTGKLVREGSILKQPDLSAILGQMVSKGPGDFYSGQTARLLVESAKRAGGSLGIEDLRSFKPVWLEPLRYPFGNNTVFFPQPPAAAGGVAGAMWHLLKSEDLFVEADDAGRAHLLLESGMRAFADRSRWMLDNGDTRWSAAEILDTRRFEVDMEALASTSKHVSPDTLPQKPVARPENPSGTSFVAVDRDGGAVACSISLNNLFGTGRVAPGTGIVLATVPGHRGSGPISQIPALVLNANVNQLFWAGAASGGVAAPTALMNVLSHSMLVEGTIQDAMNIRRVHHGGLPDVSYVERGLAPAIVSSLRAAGHTVQEAPAIGRVNAFMCFGGLPQAPETCDVAHDPRGFGLSFMAEGL